MGKGFVGFGHFVRIFFLLDRHPGVIGGIQQLTRKTLPHGAFTTRFRRLHNPACAERLAPVRPHFNRHLVRQAGASASVRPLRQGDRASPSPRLSKPAARPPRDGRGARKTPMRHGFWVAQTNPTRKSGERPRPRPHARNREKDAVAPDASPERGSTKSYTDDTAITVKDKNVAPVS